LRERGWVEGQNIVIASRYAEGRLERFSFLDNITGPAPYQWRSVAATTGCCSTGSSTFLPT